MQFSASSEEKRPIQQPAYVESKSLDGTTIGRNLGERGKIEEKEKSFCAHNFHSACRYCTTFNMTLSTASYYISYVRNLKPKSKLLSDMPTGQQQTCNDKLAHQWTLGQHVRVVISGEGRLNKIPTYE